MAEKPKPSKRGPKKQVPPSTAASLSAACHPDRTPPLQGNALHRSMIDNLPGMAFRCRNQPEWPMVFVSQGAEELTGYTPAELLESGDVVFNSIIHPNDQNDLWKEIQQALREGRTYRETYRIITKGGEVKWVLETGAGVLEGTEELRFVEGFISDFTDQKRLEEELRTQTASLEQLLDTAPEGIAVLDQDRKVIRINSEFSRIFGFTQEEIIGHFPHDLIIPLDVMREGVDLGEELYSGKSVRAETLRKCKDGSLVDVSILATPLREKGRTKGSFVIYRDISDRKKAEKELRQSEARYRFLISNSPVGIFTFDTTGRIMEVNDKCLEIIGSPGADKTKSINVLKFPLMVEAGITDDMIKCLESGETVVAERPYTSNWGVSRHLRYQIAPLKGDDGTIQGAQFIMEDFTDRKAAEDALKISEDKMRAIFNNAAVGIVVTDPEGRYIRVNEAWAEMVGYTTEELVGRFFTEFTHPEDRKDSELLWGKLRSGEIRSYRLEKKYIRKDGSLLWAEVAVSPILDAEGRTEEIIAIVVDVTERKLVEEERIKREKLQSAIETAGAVCHELNQPLQALMGRVELLLMGTVNEKEAAHLRSVEEEINRMAEITLKLQRITKYETHDYLDESKILDIDKSSN